MSEVYVVTNADLGWDCVVGVFDRSISLVDLHEKFPAEQHYFISIMDVNIGLEDF